MSQNTTLHHNSHNNRHLRIRSHLRDICVQLYSRWQIPRRRARIENHFVSFSDQKPTFCKIPAPPHLSSFRSLPREIPAPPHHSSFRSLPRDGIAAQFPSSPSSASPSFRLSVLSSGALWFTSGLPPLRPSISPSFLRVPAGSASGLPPLRPSVSPSFLRVPAGSPSGLHSLSQN